MLFALIDNKLTWEFNLVLIVCFVLALLVALILHEIAHGLAAYWMGDPSAKLAGRLSPNPAKHIDPLGLASFCLAGIGWAKPVPVNPFNYKNFRRGNFIVSIAGIVTNLVLGFISSLCLYLIYKYQSGNIGSNLGFFALHEFFYWCTILNIMLMIFNLLPIFPLDGFNMLVSFTKPNNKFMNFMRQNSVWVLLTVMIVLIATRATVHASEFIINGFFDFWGLMI